MSSGADKGHTLNYTISQDNTNAAKVEELRESLIAILGKRGAHDEGSSAVPTNKTRFAYHTDSEITSSEISPSDAISIAATPTATELPILTSRRRPVSVRVEAKLKDKERDIGTGAKMEDMERDIDTSIGDESDLHAQIEYLTASLKRLKSIETSLRYSKDNREPWKTVYRHKGKLYMSPPQWQHRDDGLDLIFSRPIRRNGVFLERNPGMHFVIIVEYDDIAKPVETDQELELPLPAPSREMMSIVSGRMSTALADMSRLYPKFSSTLPGLDFYSHEIASPYLCFFTMEEKWQENAKQLPLEQQKLLGSLFDYLSVKYIPLYKKVRQVLRQGKVSKSMMPFLVRPGDVITDGEETPTCYIAQSWLKRLILKPSSDSKHARNSNDHRHNPLERTTYDGQDSDRGNRLDSPMRGSHLRTKNAYDKSDLGDEANPDGGRAYRIDFPIGASTLRTKYAYDKSDLGDEANPRQDVYQATGAHQQWNTDEIWSTACWQWELLYGSLDRKSGEITLKTLSSVDGDELFDIRTLNFYPLQYAKKEVKSIVAKRADTFRKCGSQQFVEYEYRSGDANGIDFATERFMIDFDTYRLLHSMPTKELSTSTNFRKLGTMPTDDSLSACPSSIIGYNMRQKKWMDIEVDRICPVQWNKQAFESLAIDEKTKFVVRALISKQIATEISTDLISGKGNGLIMLLHGGPGTGKTLTAESVAELVEKPLYRVTCGDIGTTPEDVEKYLEAVLRLGKIWGCVVLLDEADVFLEERTLTDLNRNALVSVFLRVLEYYDGILILTSNRVGTFDEAFKSRIQLGIHYKPLDISQRTKIWRNFINRINEMSPGELDYHGLSDLVGELAKEDMNGRQIRNVFTTARQLAQFKEPKAKCGYRDVKDAIDVSTKFDRYLDEVKGGFTAEELARDDKIR